MGGEGEYDGRHRKRWQLRVLSQLVKCDRERDICNTFNAIWDYDRKLTAEFGQS